MKQYCRYCVALSVNNYPYCDKHEEVMSESYCKRPNNCKDFELVNCEPEFQDAFFENLKGYKPRAQRKIKADDGQQLKLDI